MMLPVKYRPVINFNGKEYPKEFSTDVSIGQFLGYRVKVGKSYTQFMQAGVFAGPTMIQFPTAAIDANGNPIPDKISNDNLIGFTHGAGLVFQFERLQLGLVIGKDNLGGEKSKQWQYDNQRWYSFAIGYKFFDNKWA
ncbi:MAG: hypothetical protein IT258_09260 [Saprospiraceae bacterium]|nr:hypothetical protein [Saprospiraceae bacterium]